MSEEPEIKNPANQDMDETGGGEVAKGGKKLSVKIFSIACTALTAIIIALTCYVVISMIVARAQNRPINLFGTSFAIVQTPSMEPEIMAGDMIFFHGCKFSDIEEGDNIVFIAGESFGAIRGQSVVHKVLSVTPDGLVTKGVNNAKADDEMVTADNFIGICTGNSAFWGAAYAFLMKFGILILIAIVVIPFIIAQIVKIFRLSKQGAAEGDGDIPDDAELNAARANMEAMRAKKETEEKTTSSDSETAQEATDEEAEQSESETSDTKVEKTDSANESVEAENSGTDDKK